MSEPDLTEPDAVSEADDEADVDDTHVDEAHEPAHTIEPGGGAEAEADDHDDAMDPEKKAARAAAKKESAGRLKGIVKTAQEASAVAKASPSIATHEAAEHANRAAFNAASAHYLNHRGGVGIHDLSRAHANEAQHHQGEKEKIQKVENDRRNAEWALKQQTPAYKASQHVKAAEEYTRGAHESQHYSTYRPGVKPSQAYAQEGHQAHLAIQSLEAAHAIEPDRGHQAEADRLRTKHASAIKAHEATSSPAAAPAAAGAGGDFDESKHPRDEQGKFASDSAWETVQRLDLASGDLGERKRTQQGGLVARANLTRTGVLEYTQPDGTVRRELRHPDEVFDPESLKTLAHATLTVDHPDKVTPGNWKSVTVGHVAGTPHKAGKFVQGDIHIQHGDAIEKAEKGRLQELSCGYECALDPTPGVFEGQPYDAVQRRIRYNHVAAGPAGWGRAGSEVRMHLDGGAGVSGSLTESHRYVRDMADIELETKARADADELATLRADNAKLRGAVDVFEREKATADSNQRNAATQARADAEFDAHLEMLEEARVWLGPKWARKREDGSRKTLKDIRREIVGALEPGMKLDGSDDYIAGACAAAIRRAEQGQAGLREMQFASHYDLVAGGSLGDLRGDAKAAASRPAPEDEGDDEMGQDAKTRQAQDAMFAKQKDAWKKNKRDRSGVEVPMRSAFGGGNQGNFGGSFGPGMEG